MRVAQLTDLHLVKDRRRRVWEVDVHAAFEHALRAAREHEPDYFVLTGDLAHDGHARSYEALRRLLGDVKDRTLVLAGNHDHPIRLREALGATHGAPGRIGFSVRAGGWHLLGMDTKVRGRVLGRAGDAQLEWLDRELSSGSEPAILFLHHPPVLLGTRWIDASRLSDADQLDRVARKHPRLRAVACGHAHMNAIKRLGDVDVYVTPSPAFQLSPGSWWPRVVGRDGRGAGFRLFDLSHTCKTEVVLVGGLRAAAKRRG